MMIPIRTCVRILPPMLAHADGMHCTLWEILWLSLDNALCAMAPAFLSASCSAPSLGLTILQVHGPFCCPNLPNRFLPQSLCAGCSLCQQHLPHVDGSFWTLMSICLIWWSYTPPHPVQPLLSVLWKQFPRSDTVCLFACWFIVSLCPVERKLCKSRDLTNTVQSTFPALSTGPGA